MSSAQSPSLARRSPHRSLYDATPRAFIEYETPLRAPDNASYLPTTARTSALSIIMAPSPDDTSLNLSLHDDAVLGSARAGAPLLSPSPESTHVHRKTKQTTTRNAARRPLATTTATVDMHAFRTCIILAMPWAAYSVFNTVFHDVRTSYLKSMGIADTFPRFVPPLVTFFLAPILGAASDRSLSHWGRRNAFLVSAALTLTVAGLLFGAAQVLFADYTGAVKLLLVIVSIGLVLINIGLRARIMDEVPIEYQVHAQAAVAMWDGVGSALGLLLFRNTAVVVFASDISGRDILVAFSAALAGLLVTTAACVYLRREAPQDRPAFQPPLARLVRDVVDQIVYAPMLFRKLCLVHFVLYFAWSSFKDETYHWWGSNVYDGCKDAGADCSADGLQAYRDGLDTANLSLMCQNGLQVVTGLLFLCVIPRVPNASFVKCASIVGLVVGELALIVAVSVGKHWLPLTVGAFITTGFYQTVVTVFPYAVVGIMGKAIQDTAHGFSNNGLYIGVLLLFSAASELTVQVYGAERIAPLGTGNVLALSCVLFAIGAVCTAALSVTTSCTQHHRRGVRRKQRAAAQLAGVPGPNGHFLVGLLPELAKNKHRIYDYFEELMVEYGGRVKLPWNLFRNHLVFISDPVDVEYVLSTNMTNWIKSDLFLAAIREVFSRSLLGLNHAHTADNGADFRLQRKLITRLFTTSNFRLFTEHTFATYAQSVVDIVKQQHGTCNMHTIASQFTLQTIFDITFGLSLAAFDATGRGRKFIASMDYVFQTISQRLILKPYFQYLWWCMPSEYRVQREAKVLLDLVDSILQQRLCESEDELAKRSDVLSLVIIKRRELAAMGEADALDTPTLLSMTTSMLFAGRDSVTSTTVSAFHMLAKHPEEQTKILDELNKSVDTTATLTYDVIKRLTYLDAFVWETLRLYPTVPNVGKCAAEDDVLPDGTFIPAGTDAIANIYYMTRHNAALWGDDQLAFRPARWLEMTKRPSTYEFPIFLAGPRICTGMNMALLQVKFFVVTMLREFHVKIQDGEPIEDRPYEFGPALKMVGGLPLQLTPREAAVGAT